MEPEEQGADPARRRAEERATREKRISLLIQLAVLVCGIALLAYGVVSYGSVASSLRSRAPQSVLLPFAFGIGIVYFGLRAVAVYRQLRRGR
jgi:fatty acid desaturase